MTALNTGGRRLIPAAIEARSYTVDAEREVSRKEMSAAARDAEKALRLTTGPRLILRELVGCWGEEAIQGRLMVWPSNQYLMDRTGLSERAVRYGIRRLVDLRLIATKDSANGKRYMIKDLAGTPIDAFGFDLSPLYARRGEWVQMLAATKAQRDAQKHTFDEITVCRRAVEEALLALSQSFPEIDRSDIEQRYSLALQNTPRRSYTGDLSQILGAWRELRMIAEKTFYEAGCGGNSCRHYESNNGSSSETCNKGFPGKAEPVSHNEQPEEHLSLKLILEACPTLTDFGKPILDWADLVAAARYLRASMQAHESAWREAVDELGALKAAAVVAICLQFYEDDVASGKNRIRNPGGYFRAIVRKVRDGKFNLETEFLALRRRHMT